MDSIESPSLMLRFSSSVVYHLENVFYRHGRLIARRPVLVLAIMSAISLLASLGLINLTFEGRPEKLWIPKGSDYVKTMDWQKRTFPDTLRREFILYESDNVISPSSILKMFEMKNAITNISVVNADGRTYSYHNLCHRVPALGGNQRVEMLELAKILFSGEVDPINPEAIDWSLTVERQTYCQLFSEIPTACLYLGILDMWPNNWTLINSLNQKDIIDSINSIKESDIFGYPKNFSSFLGGVKRNENGQIIEAKSALNIWVMENEYSTSITDIKHFSSGVRLEVSDQLRIWEDHFVEKALHIASVTNDLQLYPSSGSSISEVIGGSILHDVGFLTTGTVILALYVFLMLGNFNWVETRPVLTFLGLVSVMLSVMLSYGLCSALGIIYSPIHSILPLLLLGLGVDDMFVIVQSWINLHAESKLSCKKGKIELRMAKAMRKAGVAITVTSLTDFLAFAIGSLTSLPALRSFCIYAATGVLSLYLMQITFFLASFTLDQARLEASRNGFLWCIKHENFQPKKCTRISLSEKFIKIFYMKWITNHYTKIAILILTAFLTAVCTWGMVSLKQDFNIFLFLPKSSYLSKFMLSIQKFYPDEGYIGSVYLETPNFPEELPKLKYLVESLENNEFIATVDSWYHPFVAYTYSNSYINLEEENIDEKLFSQNLGKFLYSRSGAAYASFFRFSSTLGCMDDASKILANKIEFKHKTLYDRDIQIAAMDQVKSLVQRSNFSGFAAATGVHYSTWETNKIIVQELTQNLCLALLAVFIMTSVMIANFLASLLVLICVGLTLVDVMALMCWWNLTIDTVTCIDIVLCVGLSVDYSAHVAVHFMRVSGSRDERVKVTLLEVGSPVFHGALSTFLAFVLLANSESYVFGSFFKVFLGVFIFGVYHGLVFLPVVLSLIGPQPYLTHVTYEENDEETKIDRNLKNETKNLEEMNIDNA